MILLTLSPSGIWTKPTERLEMPPRLPVEQDVLTACWKMFGVQKISYFDHCIRNLCECSNYLKLLVGLSNFDWKVIETLLEWNLFWIIFDVRFWGSKAFVPWDISLIHWSLLLPSGNVSLWSINMKRVIFTFWRKFW